ncbi:Maleamate amidohydrolase [Lachnellula hyalina]|uniref:Maleamate amidohydrolase n=1 Tax=Lachnellula hyalina TaxID=1316788 RepID=A0A8H8TXU9_9HELO|nr:Maleamate amidohydrolase [Lachnellula hyalina]TVY24262.1 Maleamate amidohydrolase [Lachnellula hyalina]
MADLEYPPMAPSYQSAHSNSKLGWGSRPALMLIDVCRAYWSDASPLNLLGNPEAAASPDSMRRLLSAARASNTPVLWAQVKYNKGSMLDGGMQYKKSAGCNIWQEGDTRGMDAWLPGLEAAAEDSVVYKKNPSAFFATTLSAELQMLGVDTLVLCGVSTSGCVRATALDAVCHGFRPMVVGSASGDRSPAIQNATLRDLDANYADVVSEEEAISKLLAGWS